MSDHPPIERRTILRGATWSVPVLASVSLSPMSAASAPCVDELDLSTLGAEFVANGTGSAYFSWRGVFGVDDELRLNVAAVKTSTGAGQIAPANLTLETAPVGSTFGAVSGATSALRLSVTTDSTWLEVRYDFSFTYAPSGGSPQTYGGASGVTFTVTDVDGAIISEGGPKGNERVSFLPGATGTVSDPAYVMGSGTFTDPWARRPDSVPSISNLDTYGSGAGNIAATASGAEWSLRYRTNNAALVPNPSGYNLWITPIVFRGVNPSPC